MKVLITGGDGDIAKALEAELVESPGFEVKRPGKGELDVTSISSAEKYVSGWVPDVLVNNAGFVVPARINETDIERERLSLDINLFGVFNCTHAVLSRNPSARVVNIGSAAAEKVHGTWSSYCAAKAGVVMATRCWAEDGFDVVCVSPGRTRTKMRESLYSGEDPTTLLKPKDFARVVLKGILGEYAPGSNVNVNVGNIQALLGEAARKGLRGDAS